ncbi:MAG: discoidin domain-containing protein, partial [Kiritimatiellaeota bacterium]|nr:discoidin domain-containing protein [Kiritimatiellota bacterium]
WVYPAAVAATPPSDFVVCEKWETAKAALAAGKKVIYFALSANSPESMRGRFLPVFWSPVWFPSQKPNTMGLLCDPKHPLFAQFPTEMHSNWQWFDLQVIDNFSRNHKLALVFEGRVGAGQLLVCGLDLPYQSKEPAARQLLASLYAYAGSGKFAPKQELGAELLEKLFVTSYANKLQGLGARIRADNQHGGFEAENALDGHPETMWHTTWEDPAPKFPHHLIVELPKPAKFAGLTCLPRQDGNKNGWIKDYAVYVSADGKSWGEPVAKGAFKRSSDLQTIKFAQPAETKFLKLVAISPITAGSAFASLAELDAVLEK